MAVIRRSKKDKDALLRRAHMGACDQAHELVELARQNNIATCPLDVEKLAAVLGLTVRHEDMGKDKSGSLHEDDAGKWIISVNQNHHRTRQRFTIAHELAHYVLHKDHVKKFEDTIIFRSDETNQMESEANRFAGELLMPHSDFLEYVRNQSSAVDEIAENFGVSPLAVRVRAKQLGMVEK